jgi:hypothetical protein
MFGKGEHCNANSGMASTTAVFSFPVHSYLVTYITIECEALGLCFFDMVNNETQEAVISDSFVTLSLYPQ